MTQGPAGARTVVGDDAERMVRIIVDAFYDDPLWSWAFPDDALRRGQHEALWGLFVRGAVRYPFCWLAENESATSVWIPPGGTELSPDQEQELDRMLTGALSASAERVRLVFELFEAAHPHEEPHYYLSLLATDPRQRGHGYGLALLGANVAAIDAVGGAAYLEASNPANVPLYERYGFREWTRFQVPDGGPEIVTMWRASSDARRRQE
jgi:ribosomal protein S18 acetylase RimI-like enzyme